MNNTPLDVTFEKHGDNCTVVNASASGREHSDNATALSSMLDELQSLGVDVQCAVVSKKGDMNSSGSH